jgi:hypothetical protein
MTLIELLTFLFLIGGGALAGRNVTSLFAPKYWAEGAVAGVLLSVGAFFVIGYLTNRLTRKHAPCRCGKDELRDFKVVRDTNWKFVMQCSCGLRYLMRKGWLWYEILPDGNAILYMQRDFWCRWIPATDKNKSNKTVQRTGAIRSVQAANRKPSAAAPSDLK